MYYDTRNNTFGHTPAGIARELNASFGAATLQVGARYDYLGVLGFGLPVRGDADRLYCFEWCALAMGVEHQRWMTPEKLLLAAWGRP